VLVVVASVAFVVTAFVIGHLEPMTMSPIEFYSLLAVVGGSVFAALVLPVFRLLGMRVVLREGKVLLVGGLAGCDEGSARAEGGERGSR
jgi:hypothetical protein